MIVRSTILPLEDDSVGIHIMREISWIKTRETGAAISKVSYIQVSAFGDDPAPQFCILLLLLLLLSDVF